MEKSEEASKKSTESWEKLKEVLTETLPEVSPVLSSPADQLSQEDFLELLRKVHVRDFEDFLISKLKLLV